MNNQEIANLCREHTFFTWSVQSQVHPLNAAYNTDLQPDWIAELGRQVIDVERAFNRRAGLTAADDRLPRFFSEEPLSPHGEVFDVPAAELDSIWDE